MKGSRIIIDKSIAGNNERNLNLCAAGVEPSEREAFEKWACDFHRAEPSSPFMKRLEIGQYVQPCLNTEWAAWQARAAVPQHSDALAAAREIERECIQADGDAIVFEVGRAAAIIENCSAAVPQAPAETTPYMPTLDQAVKDLMDDHARESRWLYEAAKEANCDLDQVANVIRELRAGAAAVPAPPDMDFWFKLADKVAQKYGVPFLQIDELGLFMQNEARHLLRDSGATPKEG